MSVAHVVSGRCGEGIRSESVRRNKDCSTKIVDGHGSSGDGCLIDSISSNTFNNSDVNTADTEVQCDQSGGHIELNGNSSSGISR